MLVPACSAFANIVKYQPVTGHVLGTLLASAIYIGWAGIGKASNGHNAFFWLNHELVGGSKGVLALYIAAFIVLSGGGRSAVSFYCPIDPDLFVSSVFTFMYGLIGIRETLTVRKDGTTSGDSKRGRSGDL